VGWMSRETDKKYNVSIVMVDDVTLFECTNEEDTDFMSDKCRICKKYDYVLRTWDDAVKKMKELVNEGYVAGVCEYIK
jgi:hypothetical protein